MVLTRLLVFALSLVVGFWMIRNSLTLVGWFGQFNWAERYLGTGGSYSAWKLFGILAIVFGFLYAVGQFDIAPETVAPLGR
ncbi:MAG: hypothetical protein ACOYBJ_01260 [Patescibacteria group bacterium]|jgi:hypothetical protein